MAAMRLLAFLLLVTFAVQLVAAAVVRPSEEPAQSTRAMDDLMDSLFSVGARLRNRTAGRNVTDSRGENLDQLVQSQNNKMTAVAQTTRCHNSTDDCDELEEVGKMVTQRLLASWLRNHPLNASTRHQVAAQLDAEMENVRRLQQQLNNALAYVQELPQTIVSLDTR